MSTVYFRIRKRPFSPTLIQHMLFKKKRKKEDRWSQHMLSADVNSLSLDWCLLLILFHSLTHLIHKSCHNPMWEGMKWGEKQPWMSASGRSNGLSFTFIGRQVREREGRIQGAHERVSSHFSPAPAFAQNFSSCDTLFSVCTPSHKPEWAQWNTELQAQGKQTFNDHLFTSHWKWMVRITCS